MSIDLLSMRERIVLCKDFTVDERKLILDALALGDYSNKHEYPANSGLGSNLAKTMAWAVLDHLPPDAMKRCHRFMLAAMIAGAFDELMGDFKHASSKKH